MNRATLLLALAAVGSGCYSHPDRGDVTLYWDFQRFKLDGTTVTYDSNLANPASNGTTCAQSGVDFVSVTFPDGTYVDPANPTLDCVIQGVQGATFANFTGGAHQFVVTGYRLVGGSNVALYRSTPVTVNVTTGANNPATIDVPGIPDDLEVDARFVSQFGTGVVASTCAGAGVASLTFHLVDFAGTSVAVGNVACTDPAGVSFLVANNQGIDLDSYDIRMQAFRANDSTPIFDSATSVLVPQCTSQTFGHYGTDVGSAAWVVNLYDVTHNSTLCQ